MAIRNDEGTCWRRASTLGTAPAAGTPRCARTSLPSAAASTSSTCSRPCCASTSTPNWSRDTVAKGGTVLFVGTKRQAQATVAAGSRPLRHALRQPALAGRHADQLGHHPAAHRLPAASWSAAWMPASSATCPRKSACSIQRESRQAQPAHRRPQDHAQRLPDMIFIVDTNVEDLGRQEANKLKVPIIGMVDTNSDPDQIDYVIPSNDDAIRAVKLIVSADRRCRRRRHAHPRGRDGGQTARSAGAIWPRWSSTLGRAPWPSCRAWMSTKTRSLTVRGLCGRHRDRGRTC